MMHREISPILRKGNGRPLAACGKAQHLTHALIGYKRYLIDRVKPYIEECKERISVFHSCGTEIDLLIGIVINRKRTALGENFYKL